MSGLLAFTKIAFSAPRIALTNSIAARGYATKKLFIGNVAWGTTDEEAKEFFGQYGKPTDFYFPKDAEGRTKGYGFIEFDETEADKVIQEANGREFNGRQLRVDLANKREERPRGEFRPRREYSDRPRRDFDRNGDRPRRDSDRQYRPRRDDNSFSRGDRE
ncbi:hypothetical protein FBU30_002870 [Linnemannia zychae]|nr:hypothetical protein FBU30_002870 [Linnemannia zychae]